MFNFLKSTVMKQALKAGLAKVPPEMRDKVSAIAEKNPELLMNLAAEVQEEMKKGKNQMQALMAVADKHKDELKGLLQ
jgi:hypothetical protein